MRSTMGRPTAPSHSRHLPIPPLLDTIIGRGTAARSMRQQRKTRRAISYELSSLQCVTLAVPTTRRPATIPILHSSGSHSVFHLRGRWPDRGIRPRLNRSALQFSVSGVMTPDVATETAYLVAQRRGSNVAGIFRLPFRPEYDRSCVRRASLYDFREFPSTCPWNNAWLRNHGLASRLRKFNWVLLASTWATANLCLDLPFGR